MRYLFVLLALAAFMLTGCGNNTGAENDADPDNGALIDAYSSGCKNYTRNLLAPDDDSEIPDDDSLPATGHYPDPVVNGDQVTVTYVDHYDNCCAAEPEKSMHYGDSQFVIRLYAQEVLGGDCSCMCTFDEIWTFKVYESGTYTIEMYWGGIGEIPELIHNYTVDVAL